MSNGTIAAQDIKACDEKVDIWALGVTLFELLTGTLASVLSNIYDACHRTDPVILADVLGMHDQEGGIFSVSMTWNLSRT